MTDLRKRLGIIGEQQARLRNGLDGLERDIAVIKAEDERHRRAFRESHERALLVALIPSAPNPASPWRHQ